MAAGRVFRYLLKTWFSKPAHEREIYRWIHERGSLVKFAEVGIGTTRRAQEIIQFAQSYGNGQRMEYLGIDLFEGRPKSDGIPLKQAHKTLNATGTKAQLVPGDAASALPRVANAFRDVELLILSADQDADSIRQALMWIPRMLNDESLVLWEVHDDSGRLSFGRYTKASIEAMTAMPVRRAA